MFMAMLDTLHKKKETDQAAEEATCLFSAEIMKMLLDATKNNSKLESHQCQTVVPQICDHGEPGCTSARSISSVQQ